MTIAETLAQLAAQKGITPSADYKGIEEADDFIFAIQTDKTTQTEKAKWTLSVNGNRCVGDAFQDFVLSHAIKYGSGQNVIVPYLYFSVRTGKGECGTASLIVTSDAGGTAGAAATFALDVKAVPDDFDYTAENHG